MSERRWCTGTNRKGSPCQARPMKDRDVCIAHADRATRDSTGFGITGGRPKKPRVVDILRQRIEERIDDWLKPLDDALTATRPVLVGHGDDAFVVDTPDHAIRLKAFAEAMDRSYGRPKQQTEITGADGGPVETAQIVVPDTSVYRERVASIAAQALGVTVGNGSPANGNGRNGHH